ncbi:MAG: LPS export ABC transporter periplasmic protein LptC [Prevotellaceae bacterium]|jgi:LPS export ABC transporter protein LptC|nr:LPS export ABC transporter periplasmic protein LptC [Prevotellaceae bacterium]
MKNTLYIIIVVSSFFLLSCSENDKNTIQSFPDRASVPVLRTTDIVTMVSDSGVTRYRISAAEWAIYDKAEPPYWDFPKGVLFERFDNNLKTDANMSSDTAVYYTNSELWELTGNVRATNLSGEVFETQKLFWNQKEERIYSDAPISITQKDKKINGTGFESNQTLSKYTITKVTGIFPIEE